MKKPLLSICVPTYNRPTELSQLYTDTLKPILAQFKDIEIIICDNSSKDISGRNSLLFSEEINYFWNVENIGFAGNVLKCFNKANGYYIWLLPDNDYIDFGHFSKLYRDILVRQKYEYIHIPVLGETEEGSLVINKVKYTNPKEALKNKIVPFVLLSSVIVKKTNPKASELIVSYLKDNSFIQVALFMENIKNYENGVVFDYAIIQYKKELSGRFNIIKLYNDTFMLLNFIKEWEWCEDIDINAIMLKQHKGLLTLLIYAKAGLLKILDQQFSIQQYFSAFNNNIDKHFSIIIKRLLLKLPTWILKHLIVIRLSFSGNSFLKTYYSLRDTQKKVKKL